MSGPPKLSFPLYLWDVFYYSLVSSLIWECCYLYIYLFLRSYLCLMLITSLFQTLGVNKLTMILPNCFISSLVAVCLIEFCCNQWIKFILKYGRVPLWSHWSKKYFLACLRIGAAGSREWETVKRNNCLKVCKGHCEKKDNLFAISIIYRTKSYRFIFCQDTMWNVKRSFGILIMGMGIDMGIDSEGCGVIIIWLYCSKIILT